MWFVVCLEMGVAVTTNVLAALSDVSAEFAWIQVGVRCLRQVTPFQLRSFQA